MLQYDSATWVPSSLSKINNISQVISDFDKAIAEFRKLKEAGASQLRVLMEDTDLRKCNTTDNFLSLLNEEDSIYGKLQACFVAVQKILNSVDGKPTPQHVKRVRIPNKGAFRRVFLFLHILLAPKKQSAMKILE